MFKINKRVQALDDDFEGIVISIDGSEVSVRGDDGFVLKFRESELIPVMSSTERQQLSHVPDNVLSEKETVKRKANTRLRSKDRSQPALEVDLHIHNLTERDRGMSNYEMLNLQLDTARRQLEFAINKRIQKVVFIHGVGQGVLKEELYTLFRRYDGLKFYDANFQKYGLGATEVYIYQNVKSNQNPESLL